MADPSRWTLHIGSDGMTLARDGEYVTGGPDFVDLSEQVVPLFEDLELRPDTPVIVTCGEAPPDGSGEHALALAGAMLTPLDTRLLGARGMFVRFIPRLDALCDAWGPAGSAEAALVYEVGLHQSRLQADETTSTCACGDWSEQRGVSPEDTFEPFEPLAHDRHVAAALSRAARAADAPDPLDQLASRIGHHFAQLQFRRLGFEGPWEVLCWSGDDRAIVRSSHDLGEALAAVDASLETRDGGPPPVRPCPSFYVDTFESVADDD